MIDSQQTAVEHARWPTSASHGCRRLPSIHRLEIHVYTGRQTYHAASFSMFVLRDACKTPAQHLLICVTPDSLRYARQRGSHHNGLHHGTGVDSLCIESPASSAQRLGPAGTPRTDRLAPTFSLHPWAAAAFRPQLSRQSPCCCETSVSRARAAKWPRWVLTSPSRFLAGSS